MGITILTKRGSKEINNIDLILALLRQNKALKGELKQIKGYNELMQEKLFEYENEIVELELKNEELTEKVGDSEEEINDLKIDIMDLEDNNYNWFSDDDF